MSIADCPTTRAMPQAREMKFLRVNKARLYLSSILKSVAGLLSDHIKGLLSVTCRTNFFGHRFGAAAATSDIALGPLSRKEEKTVSPRANVFVCDKSKAAAMQPIIGLM